MSPVILETIALLERRISEMEPRLVDDDYCRLHIVHYTRLNDTLHWLKSNLIKEEAK
jgi:hypothetical protein